GRGGPPGGQGARRPGGAVPRPHGAGGEPCDPDQGDRGAGAGRAGGGAVPDAPGRGGAERGRLLQRRPDGAALLQRHRPPGGGGPGLSRDPAPRPAGGSRRVRSAIRCISGSPPGGRGAVRASRKGRTAQGRVVGNPDPGRPEGQCHREQTATVRGGKGETVV